MKIRLNDPKYTTELTSYFKVFYPIETIEVGEFEQHLYLVTIESEVIKVAYLPLNEPGIQIEKTKNDIEDYAKGLKLGFDKVKMMIVKNLLYDICIKATGVHAPWGILVGIRPSKLAHKLYARLGSYDQVSDVLRNYYKMSHEKVNLLIDVIKTENLVLTDDEQKHSIYIGIPFCPTRCTYCSFTSYPVEKWRGLYDLYTDVLIREMRHHAKAFENVRSIYIGGGTPTSLTEYDFEKLVTEIRCLLGNQEIEFTVEAGRPDTISEAKLLTMKKYGVNRISINPQTIHDHTLKTIGRQHTASLFYEKVALARTLGFNHINMDIILGLPQETPEDVEETMTGILALNPESITVHTMALKRGTVLTENKSQYYSQMHRKINAMLEISQHQLRIKGYKAYYLYRQKNMVGNYENVGYCKNGYESLYNIHTMVEKETIIAFGAGAISKKVSGTQLVRHDHPKDVKTYIEQIEKILNKNSLFWEL